AGSPHVPLPIEALAAVPELQMQRSVERSLRLVNPRQGPATVVASTEASSVRGLRCTPATLGHAPCAAPKRVLRFARAEPRALVLDRDERSDRGVGPDSRGLVERELDAAEALRGSERGAVERVQGVAAVEVADPADAGVVVVRAVGVRAA